MYHIFLKKFCFLLPFVCLLGRGGVLDCWCWPSPETHGRVRPPHRTAGPRVPRWSHTQTRTPHCCLLQAHRLSHKQKQIDSSNICINQVSRYSLHRTCNFSQSHKKCSTHQVEYLFRSHKIGFVAKSVSLLSALSYHLQDKHLLVSHRLDNSLSWRV